MSDIGDSLGDAYINVSARTAELAADMEQAKAIVNAGLASMEKDAGDASKSFMGMHDSLLYAPKGVFDNLRTSLFDPLQHRIEATKNNFDGLGGSIKDYGQGMTVLGEAGGLIEDQASAASNLGMQLASAAGYAGIYLLALQAAWKLGGMIGDGIANMIEPLEDGASKAAEEFRNARKELEAMDKVKLDQLKERFKELANIMDPYIKSFERMNRRERSVEEAQGAVKMAEIKATMGEGPEKVRAIADQQYIMAQAKAKADKMLANDTITAALKQKTETEKELARLKKEASTISGSLEDSWKKRAAQEALALSEPILAATMTAAAEKILDAQAELRVIALEEEKAILDHAGASAKANEMDLKAQFPKVKETKELIWKEEIRAGSNIGSAQGINQKVQDSLFDRERKKLEFLAKIAEEAAKTAKNTANGESTPLEP